MPKSNREKNTEYLKNLSRGAPVGNRSKIARIITFYKNNNIGNVRTAANNINLLASKNRLQREKGLKQYKNNISKAVDKIGVSTDTELKKYGKVIDTVSTDHTVNIGDHSKITSHIDFKIHSSKLDDKGNDKRTIGEVVGGLRSSLYKELSDALIKNKSLKFASRLTFVVVKDEEEFDKKK